MWKTFTYTYGDSILNGSGGHYESYQGETKESESSNIEYEHP